MRELSTSIAREAKRIALLATLLALCPGPSSAAGNALGGPFGIMLGAGACRSLDGAWTASQGMREATKLGPAFEVAVEKWIGGHYRCEAAAMLAWMDFEPASFPPGASDPSFTTGALLFGNFYHFTEARIRPFVAAGTGIYFWKMNTDKPLGGVLRVEGTRFQKASWGLNAGLGLEWAVSPLVSVMLEARYHYILSEDGFLFGDAFTEQGVLTAGLGVSYSFSRRLDSRWEDR